MPEILYGNTSLGAGLSVIFNCVAHRWFAPVGGVGNPLQCVQGPMQLSGHVCLRRNCHASGLPCSKHLSNVRQRTQPPVSDAVEISEFPQIRQAKPVVQITRIGSQFADLGPSPEALDDASTGKCGVTEKYRLSRVGSAYTND